MGTLDNNNQVFRLNYERMYEFEGEATRRQNAYLKKLETTCAVASQKEIHCPVCNSKNVRRLGEVERGASILAFGLLSNKIGKMYECNDCRYKW